MVGGCGSQCLEQLGWERERHRGRERKNKKCLKKIINKEYLNEVVKKNRNFDIRCIVKWRVKCYKIGFFYMLNAKKFKTLDGNALRH